MKKKYLFVCIFFFLLISYISFNCSNSEPSESNVSTTQEGITNFSNSSETNLTTNTTNQSNSSISTTTSLTGTASGITWVSIPSGIFIMGNSSNSDEAPSHTVNITTFYMLDTEVTIAQYIEFLNDVEHSDNGRWVTAMSNSTYCGISRSGINGSYSYFLNNISMSNYPVTLVNWANSCDFCNWISGTLPSEAQWEYASGGPSHLLWSLSNTFTSSGYCYNASGLCSVKNYPANGFGLYDMSGGVVEWTYDTHTFYGSSGTNDSSYSFYQNCFNAGTVTNPINNYYNPLLDMIWYRTARGGSWNDNTSANLRSSKRFFLEDFERHNYTGFRCSR